MSCPAILLIGRAARMRKRADQLSNAAFVVAGAGCAFITVRADVEALCAGIVILNLLAAARYCRKGGKRLISEAISRAFLEARILRGVVEKRSDGPN